ncbi:uncharacterized protein LOC116164093 [Photinus pyralis]|uniref:uncharacterized protein LOC116160573 n=1 Tax=Photinus pyralis TaxID=7054 RepID=UPI001266F1B4|nr:uncharacterized protein LOC116160573 [Photinus pyralis]XP_031334080.1 uncharacterized protein LOC116164093 [Photinus pyralis]
MVERLHRQLKAALMCHHSESWLPIVLLGIRTAFKEDLQASIAEIVYGQTLRLPGEMLTRQNEAERQEDASSFVVRLRRYMADLRPVPASHHSTPKVFVFQDLATCSHVFLRDDTVRRSLQPPYTGPYAVIRRDSKTVTIRYKGSEMRVSMDRVKPAYLLDVDTTPSPIPATKPSNTHPTTPPSSTVQPYVTRAGRHVRFRLP